MSVWDVVVFLIILDVGLWSLQFFTSWFTNLSSGEYDEEE